MKSHPGPFNVSSFPPLTPRHNNNPICQSCKEEEPGTINEEGLLSVEKAFSDAAINKEISELPVHCGIPGCNWTGVMKSLEDHQSTCEYAPIPCHVGCGEVVMRKKLAEHLQNDCPNAIPSSDCNQKVSGSKHQNRSMVSVSEKSCRFSRIGCPFKGDTEDRNSHEKNAAALHLALLLQHIKQLRESLCPADGRGNAHLTDSNVLTGIFSVQLQGALEVDRYSRLPLYEEGTSWRTHSQGENGVSLLERKLRVCQDIASVLSKEMATSRQTIMAFRGLNLDMIHGLELKAADLQQCLAQKEAALGRLEERLRLCEQASYDGIFQWKITDVHRKWYEAVCGKTCSFQSPAFYTSRYGYKLCMRIYLNGEGREKGTHVSLFIVLLRGDYDALLQWPFTHKITFMLLSQNDGDHLLNAIQPDPASTSFQRPVTDMNDASGCPRFISLAKLRSPKYAYIRDGSLFLKCVAEDRS
ncbi:TNF receptor-associated factor 1 [Elgaria multicarinata webbii]|uniref:TNF receptor-associated factor 1 n=1 Tax=Elgaria multicarinata webbii TaxID=159646 RepID=UPI002FCCD5DF